MSDIIFTTIHGSHLYGTTTEISDKDYFVLTNNNHRSCKQNISNGIDTVIMSFKTFQDRINNGSPQALEALFSPVKIYNPTFSYFKDYFDSHKISGGIVFDTYKRTIKSFCFGDLKKRIHAVRLAQNLIDLCQFGKFNPMVTNLPPMLGIASEIKNQNLYDFLKGKINENNRNDA